jgi:hypothetical protein
MSALRRRHLKRRARTGYATKYTRTTCQECGASPAVFVEIRAVAGFVVVFKPLVADGSYCRACGLRELRDHMNWTLLIGWWGVSSLFVNLNYIDRNLRSWWALRRLPVADPDADEGTPVWLQPGVWFALAFPVAMYLLVRWVLST